MIAQWYMLQDATKPGEFVPSIAQPAKRAELDALVALVKKVAGIDRSHLVAELVTLEGKLGLRVVQKKCAVTHEQEVSLPFFPLPPAGAKVLRSDHKLCDYAVRESAEDLARRTQGNLKLTPVLMTAQGKTVSGKQVYHTRTHMYTRSPPPPATV